MSSYMKVLSKLFLFFSLYLFSIPGFSCQCPADMKEGIVTAYERYNWIFVGTYTKEHYDKDNHRKQGYFKVDENIKGDTEKLPYFTRPMSTKCMTPMSVGMKYIFFVGNDKQIAQCNHTRILVDKSFNEFYKYTNKTVKKLRVLSSGQKI